LSLRLPFIAGWDESLFISTNPFIWEYVPSPGKWTEPCKYEIACVVVDEVIHVDRLGYKYVHNTYMHACIHTHIATYIH